MSLVVARKKRTSLYLSIAGLMVMVAAVSAISAQDPSGVSLRIGMIMVTVGAGLWLPWRQLIPAALLAWLVPNLARSLIDDVAMGSLNMLLEMPGIAGVAFFTWMARHSLGQLEQESLLIGTGHSDLAGLNPETGIYDENQLRPALAGELARSRRFGRSFSLVLVGLDEMRQKFDFRDEAMLKASLEATCELLRQTRHNVDRVFHYRGDEFAIILPESSEKDIPGLVKRLRRLARSMKPAEGEPGGPMPVHFGATFFPECATTVDDMLRRAEITLKLASTTTTRYQLDSAEAPELPPVESLRRESVEVTSPESPPVMSNPVAAAIVGEAYAERAREADADAMSRDEDGAAPVLETEAVATADESIEMPPGAAAAKPIDATPVAASEEPASAETAMDAEEGHPEETVERGPEAQGPPAEPESPVTPEQEQAKEPAPVLAGSAAEHASDSTEPVAATMDAHVDDDFEALLKQMDETLAMIKSVRNHAA